MLWFLLSFKKARVELLLLKLGERIFAVQLPCKLSQWILLKCDVANVNQSELKYARFSYNVKLIIKWVLTCYATIQILNKKGILRISASGKNQKKSLWTIPNILTSYSKINSSPWKLHWQQMQCTIWPRSIFIQCTRHNRSSELYGARLWS